MPEMQPPASHSKKRGRPTQSGSDSSRRLILRHAAALFRQQGYDHTTVRDIAAASGMQAGSWFYHYKSKHDMLRAVMEQGLLDALEKIEAIQQQPLNARELFTQLVSAHLETLVAPEHDFIPVLLYEWRALNPEARQEIVHLKDRYEAVWEACLHRLQAEGSWHMPGEFDKLWMFGALNWTAQWYRPHEGQTLATLSADAVRFLLRC